MKLAQVIALYVAFRKNLGVNFENDAKLLQMFSRAVGETLDISSVQADRVKAFLDGCGPITRYWHRKLTFLRGFYRYAISRGYVAEAPLPTMVPKQPERFVPHIYSREELQRLLDGTANYQNQRIQMEPHTFRTILLALYGAALREGECLSLTLSDVDLHQSLLTIRDTKFYKSRLVPLGCDLNKAMLRYAGQRKTAIRRKRTRRFSSPNSAKAYRTTSFGGRSDDFADKLASAALTAHASSRDCTICATPQPSTD